MPPPLPPPCIAVPVDRALCDAPLKLLTAAPFALPPIRTGWRQMEGEYTGHVKDGKVHGVGVCVYTDGSRYQGDWKGGLKCGRGTHSFMSGDQFEGEWENGWMHGLGVYTWKIGDKYIGEVNFGRIHGFGTYTWRTNSKCANAPTSPLPSRPRPPRPPRPLRPLPPPRPLRRCPLPPNRPPIASTIAACAPRRYVGQWKDGKMHGNGVKTDPHGTTPSTPPGRAWRSVARHGVTWRSVTWRGVALVWRVRAQGISSRASGATASLY